MNALLWIWEIIKSIFIWGWQNKKTAFYISLIIFIALLCKCNHDKSIKIEQLTTEKNGLAEKLKAKVTSGNGEVKIVYRDKEKIITRIQYLPPEGFVTVETLNKEKQGQKNFLDKLKEKISSNATLKDIKDFVFRTTIDTGDEIIVVHDRGFCFRPGFFLNYDGQYNNYPLNAGIDVKLIFFQRWSSGLSTTLEYPGVFISRHVDDLSLGICKNLEIAIIYGKPYKEFDKNILGIGFRSNW